MFQSKSFFKPLPLYSSPLELIGHLILLFYIFKCILLLSGADPVFLVIFV